MGLDIVEVVMDVEHEFSVQIPHSRWSEIRTVGDLCHVVSTLLDAQGHPVCRHIPAFCALRRGFIKLGHVRENIRPALRLVELLNGMPRAQAWSQLSQLSGCSLPDLCRPGWLVTALVLLPITGLFVCLAGCLINPLVELYLYGLFAILLGWPAYSLFAIWVTRPLVIAFPDGCNTVGDLVRETLRSNDFPVQLNPPHATAATYFSRVRRIVSEDLNIPPAAITMDSRFIEDLQAG